MTRESNINEKYKALTYGNEQFDKNVLFIASGALGVSFGFIEKLVPDLGEAHQKGCLIWSWYLFAGVIFISLLAHFVSILANRWAIINDNDSSDNYNKISRRWNCALRSSNIIMMVLLLAGMILLIAFVNQNI